MDEELSGQSTCKSRSGLRPDLISAGALRDQIDDTLPTPMEALIALAHASEGLDEARYLAALRTAKSVIARGQVWGI